MNNQVSFGSLQRLRNAIDVTIKDKGRWISYVSRLIPNYEPGKTELPCHIVEKLIRQGIPIRYLSTLNILPERERILTPQKDRQKSANK